RELTTKMSSQPSPSKSPTAAPEMKFAHSELMWRIRRSNSGGRLRSVRPACWAISTNMGGTTACAWVGPDDLRVCAPQHTASVKRKMELHARNVAAAPKHIFGAAP